MIEERVPPQNIEAEQAVLGAMLIDKEAIAKATEVLSADDFYREAHRVIFSAMLELYNKNEAVDMVTVTEILKRDNKLEDIGGIKLGAGGLVRAYSGSVAGAVKEAGLAQKILLGYYSFLYDVNSVGRILNVLYQQQLFEIADVQYDLRAKVILKMRAEQKAEAEAWLTENLNQQIELEKEGTEFAEVAL